MPLTRLVARPLIASTFVVGAVHALRHTPEMAERAKPVADKVGPLAQRAVPQAPIPQDAQTLVRLNAGVQLVAAGALATGRVPRLSAAVLAGSLLPTTLAGHRFWTESDPDTRQAQQIAFFKNLGVLGGLLIATGDTEGKPGVAWRAQRAAKDVRREAGQLAGTAKLEAKLAKANLT